MERGVLAFIDGVDDTKYQRARRLNEHIAHRVDLADVQIPLHLHIPVYQRSADFPYPFDRAEVAAEDIVQKIGIEGIHDRIFLHIGMEKGIAKVLDEFPKPRYGDGKDEPEQNAKPHITVLVFQKELGQVCAEQREHHAARYVEKFIPPLYRIIQTVRMTEHRTERVGKDEYVHGRCDPESAKLLRDIGYGYEQRGKYAHQDLRYRRFILYV